MGSLVLEGAWARLDGFQQAILGALSYPWHAGDLEAGMGAVSLAFRRSG